MNRIKQAVEQYAAIGRIFAYELDWHLVRGMVLSTQNVLCLARLCRRDNLLIRQPDKPDALYVEYLSADPSGLENCFSIFETMNLDTLCYYRGFKNQSTITAPYAKIKSLLRRNINGR